MGCFGAHSLNNAESNLWKRMPEFKNKKQNLSQKKKKKMIPKTEIIKIKKNKKQIRKDEDKKSG